MFTHPGHGKDIIMRIIVNGMFNNAKNATFKNNVMTNVMDSGKEMDSLAIRRKVQVFQYHKIF